MANSKQQTAGPNNISLPKLTAES